MVGQTGSINIQKKGNYRVEMADGIEIQRIESSTYLFQENVASTVEPNEILYPNLCIYRFKNKIVLSPLILPTYLASSS